MMNCQEFQALAQALARDEGLDVTTMEAAFTHADSCGRCDALLDEAESLTANLRGLAMRHSGEAAPPVVETALLNAFRQRHEPAASASRMRRWSAGIAGAAAAIVLVTVLAGHPKTPQATPPPHAGVAAAKQTDTPVGPSAASAAPRQVTRTAAASNEMRADSFVPLSGTYDLASLNEDAIVRVVLSDQDLESLGLPVGDSGDEQVLADLIIANDGTPQAIRVVSW